MAARHARRAIASAIAAGMSGWTVYAEPPETVIGPAIVVGPRDPYRDHLTYRDWWLFLRVSALVPRSAPGALDIVDDAIDGIVSALKGTEARLDHIGNVSVVTEGNTEFIAAAVDLSLEYDPTYTPEET